MFQLRLAVAGEVLGVSINSKASRIPEEELRPSGHNEAVQCGQACTSDGATHAVSKPESASTYRGDSAGRVAGRERLRRVGIDNVEAARHDGHGRVGGG